MSKGRIHKVTDLRTGLQQYPMRGAKGRFLSRKQAASIMHYCDGEIRESRIVAYCNVSGGIGIIDPSSGSHTGFIRYKG